MLTRTQQRQRERMLRRLRRSIAQNGIESMLTRIFGADTWSYDAREQLWIVPDRRYTGPGRSYYCVRANGDWFKATLPEGMTQ